MFVGGWWTILNQKRHVEIARSFRKLGLVNMGDQMDPLPHWQGLPPFLTHFLNVLVYSDVEGMHTCGPPLKNDHNARALLPAGQKRLSIP